MPQSLAALRDALLRTTLAGVPQKDVATLLWDKREDDDRAAFSLLGAILQEVQQQQGTVGDEQACALLTYLAVLLPLKDEWEHHPDHSMIDDGRSNSRVLRR